MPNITLQARIAPSLRLVPTAEARLDLQLLSASIEEVAGIVREQLDENPMLVEAAAADPDEPPRRPPRAERRDVDFRDVEERLAREPSFYESLAEQLLLMRLSLTEREFAWRIVENLDERGYLDADFDELARGAGVVPDVAQRVLRAVQDLEPAGIGARDDAERMLIQARHAGYEEDSLPVRLVRECWADVARMDRNRLERVARRLGATVAAVGEALRVLLRFDRTPAERAEAAGLRSAIPDVHVLPDGAGDYRVASSEWPVPAAVADGPSDNMADQRRAAEQLLECLRHRDETIRRVVDVILDVQRDFFEHDGDASLLRPLTRRYVARRIGCHESTVSRAVRGKFVATPFGTLALESFFQGSPGVNADGRVSTSGVKERIRQMIASEDACDPLTDDAICRRLRDDFGLCVDRRTVHNRREAAGIPSSHVRRGIARLRPMRVAG